jgi:hypothetical protein
MATLATMALHSWLCVFTATDGEAQSTAGAIYADFTTREDISLHEPVLLQLTIENRSTERIKVDLGTDGKENLKLQITYPDGRVVEPQSPYTGGFARTGRIRISANDSFSRQYVLDEWVTFDEPGRYVVRAEIQSPIVVDNSEIHPPAPAQSLNVNIGARDEIRLREVSENFARIAVSARGSEAKSDAALALSYVMDPVAVPYVSSVLQQTDSVDWLLVQGLVRHGTEQARAELIELSQSPNEERSALARDALRRLEMNQ